MKEDQAAKTAVLQVLGVCVCARARARVCVCVLACMHVWHVWHSQVDRASA